MTFSLNYIYYFSSNIPKKYVIIYMSSSFNPLNDYAVLKSPNLKKKWRIYSVNMHGGRVYCNLKIVVIIRYWNAWA